MEAKELRIGNWYNEFGIPTQADSRFIDRLYNIQLRGKIAIGVSPIPLTPEILEKAGFESDFESRDYWYHEEMRTFAKDRFHIYLPYKVYDSMAPCGYVHQLQNLYFALTGKELPIEL